jgi:hypothetical protein
VAPPGQEGPPAPIDFQQTLTIISGANPPEVGQTSRIEHVSTITNTSAQAMTREEVLEALATLFAAAIQGQGINVRYTTDYTGDVQVVSASANIGNAAVQGNSVVWDGQLAAGQSVELRTTFDQTPTTALTINQPIQGQSLVVSDFQGISMSVPPLPPPELPPSQRVVQPPRPQVDPTTGSRFFGSTGFSVTNDAIWVFYHRRGGARTFGPPISRELLLMGSPVQLFERGMLRVGEEDSVSIVNMLEAPFLPYEALAADLILPRVEGELIDTAPDPTAENFGTTSQDFVRRHTADSFEDRPTRFYASFMSAVLFRDAFWDGQGDPNLIPGFNLEFWGLPTSRAQYLVVGQELVQVGTTPEGDPLFGTRDIVDQNTVLQRYQRGVMRHDAVAGRPTILDLGTYLRAVLLGDESFADLAAVAAGSPLWAQYNSEEPAWVARPDELPDTNLELAFEPEQ